MRVRLSLLAASFATTLVASLSFAGPALSAEEPFDGYDIDCTTPTACQVIGYDSGQYGSQMRYTTNAGRSWSVATLPAKVSLDEEELRGNVSCASATTCVATLGYPPEKLIHTENGRFWKLTTLPKGVFAVRVSCTAPARCLAVGFKDSTYGSVGALVSLASNDGGRTWALQAPRVPAKFEADAPLDCASATACQIMTTGRTGRPQALGTVDGGRHWSVEKVPPAVTRVGSISCATARACVAMGWADSGEVITLTTTDGGRTWLARPSPLEGGSDPHVSCGTPTTCVTSVTVTASSSSRQVLLRTTDGGRTWKRGASPTNTRVGDVACVSALICQASGLRTGDGGRTWTAQPR